MQIFKTLLPVTLILSLGACAAPVSSPQTVSPSPSVLKPVNIQADRVLADVGRGHMSPARLSFSLRLGADFRKADSTPGVAAKTASDLTHIKFYLIESDTASAPTALGGTAFTYAISGTNRTNGRVDITFTNVPANTTGKSYYVLAAGFSSNSFIAANNITNLNSPINDGTEGHYYASNTGGMLNGGYVRVTPVTYALSSATALEIPLKLLDAVAPLLDSNVNVSPGDEISSTPSGNPG